MITFSNLNSQLQEIKSWASYGYEEFKINIESSEEFLIFQRREKEKKEMDEKLFFLFFEYKIHGKNCSENDFKLSLENNVFIKKPIEKFFDFLKQKFSGGKTLIPNFLSSEKIINCWLTLDPDDDWTMEAYLIETENEFMYFNWETTA